LAFYFCHYINCSADGAALWPKHVLRSENKRSKNFTVKLFYCSKLPPRYLMNGHSIIKFAAFGSGFLNASSDPWFDLFIAATRKWSAAAKIHTRSRE
jgi:hypothetical protein